MHSETLINTAYIVSAVLFIYGLKMLSSQKTARRGNMVSALGMLVAVAATLLKSGLAFEWIIVGAIAGSIVGAVASRLVKMTAMPEMVALFNGSGGIASLLVGWWEYHQSPSFVGQPGFTPVAVILAVLIGGVTFTGSLVAFGKLSERLPSKPIVFPRQKLVNALLLLLILVSATVYCLDPENNAAVFLLLVLFSFALGVLAVIPIGGADMPVVISLLNSYSGLAACAAGFVILNNVLVVAGCLVGASGLILTNIMCKAMNRSLANVLFSGFGSAGGSVSKTAAEGADGEVKPITAEDSYYILEAAQSVAIVPGYGMAVAQAQHVVRELGQLLEENGCEVRYAIHPVAGRMPGHMNVLLAEADVPYEQLFEMDDVNPVMPSIDVAIVIGANDVVNPAAREVESSPIYGMPIINVDQARTVFVLKRSMASGFAGVDNPLFLGENTRMLFGDAKASVQAIIDQFKSA